MNTKNKIMTCLMLSAGGAVSLALLNKYIQFSATSRGLTREENSLCYKWRLGNIYYTKCGSGKPLSTESIVESFSATNCATARMVFASIITVKS